MTESTSIFSTEGEVKSNAGGKVQLEVEVEVDTPSVDGGIIEVGMLCDDDVTSFFLTEGEREGGSRGSRGGGGLERGSGRGRGGGRREDIGGGRRERGGGRS